MDIRFTGQNLSITDGMRKHASKHLLKLEQYAPRLVEAHVYLKKEKYLFEAEITLLAKNFRAFGKGSAKENIFSALDDAYERVEKQLKKFRAKKKDHHKKNSRISAKVARAMDWVESEVAVVSDRPRVVRVKNFAIKPMSVDEAGLQLGVSSEIFLVFLNQDTRAVNVIYKRKDGNYGLIEPAF